MRALARAYPAGARFQVRLDLDDYWVLVAAADSGLVRPSPNCGLPWLVMAFLMRSLRAKNDSLATCTIVAEGQIIATY